MHLTRTIRTKRNLRASLIGGFVALLLLLPSIGHGAVTELRLGPVASMAIHWETEWPTVSLFTGAGLGIAGSAGSPLRDPSLVTGFKMYPRAGSTFRPYLTGMYGWTLRSAGIQPFAGGGAGLAWHFGPDKSYRFTLEADMVLRDTMVPFPSASFGLAVRL